MPRHGIIFSGRSFRDLLVHTMIQTVQSYETSETKLPISRVDYGVSYPKINDQNIPLGFAEVELKWMTTVKKLIPLSSLVRLGHRAVWAPILLAIRSGPCLHGGIRSCSRSSPGKCQCCSTNSNTCILCNDRELDECTLRLDQSVHDNMSPFRRVANIINYTLFSYFGGINADLVRYC